MMLQISASKTANNQQTQNADYECWIAAMAQGNTNALGQLYAKTKSVVYGFALSIVKNTQSAEDVMQDTYVKLFQSAKQYSPQGKPLAWVLTITRNQALMLLRSQKEVPSEDLPATQIQTDFAQNTLDRQLLQAVLQYLTDEERQIVILHSVSGLKHRELVDILQIPLPTVLSKYRRALSKLKNMLKEEEES